MEYYKEFINGGEILIAPSSDFEDIYLLKCNVCDEYYRQLETFLSHHLTHYGRDVKRRPSSPCGALSELFGDMDDNLDVNDDATTMYEDLVREEGSVSNGEYNSDCANELSTNETRFQGNESNSNDTEDIIHESIEIKRIWENERSVDAYMDSFESNDDEYTRVEDNKSKDFVQNFMKSKENVTRLITLYKNQPKLWNNNLSTHIKIKSERIVCLQQIAAELEDTINMKMPHEQLDKVIVHLRRNYRIKLEKDKIDNKQEIAQSEEDQQAHSVWQYLSFLKPILEKTPIAILDNYSQVLEPEQIVQILNIYKRCPNLWDTSLMENYCYNKRTEGIQEMLRMIQLEMNLEVNEITLQKYLHCVNINFSREKRRYMGIVMSEEGQSEYFEHMMFLYDHVGPFKCIECRRKFKTPLHLKVHRSEHDGQIPLKCTKCNKNFKTVETYIYHVRRHMNDLNKLCKACGKSFLKASELRTHMRFHTGVKPYCCEICGASFRYPQVLNIHRKRHEKKFMYFCPTCKKGFYTKCHMEMHTKIHKDEREFLCVTCGKAFKTKKTLQQHELTHEEGRNHICTICKKAFKNKMNLTHHIKTHLRKGALGAEFKSKLASVFDKE